MFKFHIKGWCLTFGVSQSFSELAHYYFGWILEKNILSELIPNSKVTFSDLHLEEIDQKFTALITIIPRELLRIPAFKLKLQ